MNIQYIFQIGGGVGGVSSLPTGKFASSIRNPCHDVAVGYFEFNMVVDLKIVLFFFSLSNVGENKNAFEGKKSHKGALKLNC